MPGVLLFFICFNASVSLYKLMVHQCFQIVSYLIY